MSELLITGIQSAIHWEDAAANLRMFEEKIAQIPEKTELVILPEMFSTGFSMQSARLAEPMDGRTVQWMKEIAQKKNIILAGSAIIEEAGNYYNRFLWVLPNGTIGYYDKRHLFAFAGEHAHYTAGNRKLVAAVKGWKIFPIVCYDLRFPVWLRQDPDRDKQYDLMICVANWPGSRVTAWRTLLQARAIENQCYVVGINRTGSDGEGLRYPGHSMIVDPLGDVAVEAGEEEERITCRLMKEKVEQTRDQFPFLRDADSFRLPPV